jgi:hypothetical protein
MRDRSWWQHPGSLRLLLSEYVKFIASAARLGWARAQAMLGTGRTQASSVLN